MASTSSQLLAEVPDLADHEARRLLLLAAREGPSWMVGDPEVAPEVEQRFRSLIARRRAGEPLQYIEGTAEFGPVEVLVDRRVLIPRPETEHLYELAVDKLAGLERPLVVDLCTGSGNLALAVKHTLPAAHVVASDISEDAVTLARANADRLGLDIETTCGDLFAGLDPQIAGQVDLIMANPPYVTADECALLPIEVGDYEPRLALDGGRDGLDVLRRIAADLDVWLRPGGWFLSEIGERQGRAITAIFAGFSPEIRQDLAGRDRFVLGRAPMPSDLH